ncbi:MAG: hypothetical protein ACOYM3_30305 [Terrimicrobiaceae bacterium]
MARIQDNNIILEVLCVASNDVLGEMTPLRVAAHCHFSNAKGNLREVESYEHLAQEAEKDGQEFRAAFAGE